MSYICSSYLPVPESETVIAYNYIYCIIVYNPFQPVVFADNMKKQKRGFKTAAEYTGADIVNNPD